MIINTTGANRPNVFTKPSATLVVFYKNLLFLIILNFFFLKVIFNNFIVLIINYSVNSSIKSTPKRTWSDKPTSPRSPGSSNAGEGSLSTRG